MKKFSSVNMKGTIDFRTISCLRGYVWMEEGGPVHPFPFPGGGTCMCSTAQDEGLEADNSVVS